MRADSGVWLRKFTTIHKKFELRVYNADMRWFLRGQ